MDTTSISSQSLPTGTRLEEFIIERVLGSGGFGITYLARDTALGRQVVIKENLPVQFCFRDTYSLTVAPRHSHGEDADNFQWSLENFSKEAAMLASLHHPGIVQVLRSFQAFGTAYFVMPFVEGVTLEDLLQSRQREVQTFTEDELCGLLQRVLSSLDHLHQRGIYHRDIKPANILITSEGVPVLIDFGSARQRLSERSMTVVESAGYTPFEQLQTRGRIGPWSDLYALGATLAKVITGEGPPKATDRAFDDPWPPLAQRQEWTVRYSTALLESIDRAMAVRIEDRFQDAGEWMAALENQTTLASPLPPSRESSSETLSSQRQLIPDQAEQKQTRQSNRKLLRYLFVTMLALLAVGAVGSVAFIGRGRGNQVAEERMTIVESRVVTKTEAETPPEKTPDQVEEPPPAVAPSVGTPMGVPLFNEIPPEFIEGAPKPMNVPNLLPASTKPPELLVPEGTVLLSRGKPVTSSDDAPIIGDLDLITDGEKDASEGYFVGLLDGLQWVQIDLEQSARISAVWLWHFHSQKRAYHDVIIQVSDDAYFKTGVTTVYNNDYDDSSKFGKGTDNPYVETRFGKLVDAKGAKGRYVRLYSNGSTSNEMNHYIEVEVFGIPAKAGAKDSDDVLPASGWNTYTNERFGFSFGYPAILKPGILPENGAGRAFTDGVFTVVAEAHFMQSQNFDKWWDEQLKARGKDVTYKVKKSTWAVVSGIGSDGMEFYLKRHVQNGMWAQFYATYPHSMNEKYDSIVAQISKRFIPFLDGDYDRVSTPEKGK
jgi:serine/threonine protein kinase